jgi:methyl-accepting chemotaxis protein
MDAILVNYQLHHIDQRFPAASQETPTMFLRLLSIRTRLIAAFILLLLLLSTVAAIGSLQIARVQFNANDLGTNWLPSTNALASIRATANEARRATLRHVIEESVPGKQAQEEALAKAEKALESEFSTYEKLISSPEEKKLYDKMRVIWDAVVLEPRDLRPRSSPISWTSWARTSR